MQKKCSMIYLTLPPKAEEGWIKPDQCQVNSTWLELTYYIETLCCASTLLLCWNFLMLSFRYSLDYEDELDEENINSWRLWKWKQKRKISNSWHEFILLLSPHNLPVSTDYVLTLQPNYKVLHIFTFEENDKWDLGSRLQKYCSVFRQYFIQIG